MKWLLDKVGNFQLTKKITINLSKSNGLWSGTNNQLDIHIWGNTLDEIYDRIEEEFEFLVDEYGKTADELLGPSAKKLKNKINLLIQET